MKKLLILFTISIFLNSCGGGDSTGPAPSEPPENTLVGTFYAFYTTFEVYPDKDGNFEAPAVDIVTIDNNNVLTYYVGDYGTNYNPNVAFEQNCYYVESFPLQQDGDYDFSRLKVAYQTIYDADGQIVGEYQLKFFLLGYEYPGGLRVYFYNYQGGEWVLLSSPLPDFTRLSNNVNTYSPCD